MKALSVLLVASLCFLSLAFAREDLTTNVEAVAKVFQVTPPGVATVAESRWMQFLDCTGSTACCSTLSSLSLEYKNGPPQFTPVAGLVLNVPVDQAHRASSNILITWTVRIEGHGKIVNPWGSLCSKRQYGRVMETFKGGDVYSQAYIDMGPGFGYQAFGQPAKMTVPDGGGGVVVNIPEPPPEPRDPPSDPTNSGSCLLKPSDFPGGSLPATVKIMVYWKNDTSMSISSSANYRSLNATVLPSRK
ncbi:MAG: hypothetical protein V1830_02640 [Candidatus Omnitrophota bacterium]